MPKGQRRSNREKKKPKLDKVKKAGSSASPYTTPKPGQGQNNRGNTSGKK